MRQAGVLAAAGLFALDHMVDRLADDHANARSLADGLRRLGWQIDREVVETNIFFAEPPPGTGNQGRRRESRAERRARQFTVQRPGHAVGDALRH